MALRPRINPTPEQLQAAWVRRRRRHWPDSFDAAMADPLLGRLVHMEAVLLVLAQARAARRSQAPPPQPSAAARQKSTSPHRITTPDRKRLAAGDTDDDH